MKRISIILLALCAIIPAILAQKAPTQDRGQWMKEIREYKHTFLAKELKLSKDQQNKFFPLYDEMEDKTAAIAAESRQINDRVAKAGDKATDADYDKAIEALVDQKARELELMREYMEKFKTILTKKQLFQLRGAERNFTRDIMKHNRRLRADKSKK